MTETMFAGFNDAEHAEQAAGALLDRGAKPEDVSVIVGGDVRPEAAAKAGVSTTTSADTAVGAAKGAGIGAGIGAAALLASLFIPGVGLVLGAGALATALAAAAGSAVGGAIAGGVVGSLVDQGVRTEDASKYELIVRGGGALVALSFPSGELTKADALDVLSKYQAIDLNVYARTPV